MKYIRMILVAAVSVVLFSAFTMKGGYQLKNYLEYQKGKPDYTCAIYFSEHKSKLEKELSKVRKSYAKGDTFILENVKQTEFIFKKPKEY